MSELREKFKAKAESPIRTDIVKDVPGIGDVKVRGLTGAEYDEYESSCVTTVGKTTKHKANRPLLLRMGVLNGEDKNLFRDDDMDLLKSLGADVTVPLATAIMRLSGATAEEAEAVEKN